MEATDGNRNDHEEQERLNLLIGGYWLRLLGKYKRKRVTVDGRRWTDLELRRYFRGEAIIRELKVFLISRGHGNAYRNVPNMQELCNQELAITVTEFIEKFEEELLANGYSVERAKVERRFAAVFTPASDLFYCLHCKSNVHITPQFKCPLCCGWCLLEMDPNNEHDIPSLPLESYMKQTTRRLIPDTRPTNFGLRDDAITNVQVTHVHQNMECLICIRKFKVQEIMVKIICGHLYHRKCIKEWFARNNWLKKNCPQCRMLMPTVDSLLNIHLRSIAIEKEHLPPPHTP